MKGLRVDIYAPFVSFRDPGAQLYHETLPLPPPTTLLGMVGAAMGKSFEEMLLWARSIELHVGCIGISGGRGKDLWNYIKIKTDKKTDEPTHAVILRTFLADFRLSAYFACEQVDVMNAIYEAFQSPYYAITLGTSDELAKILTTVYFDNVIVTQSSDLSNTIVSGDYSRKFKFDWEKVETIPIAETLRPPIVKKLPIDFSIDTGGVRKASKFLTLTFLSDKQQLLKDVPVYKFANVSVPMVKFSG